MPMDRQAAEAEFWSAIGPVSNRERAALIEQRLPSQYAGDRLDVDRAVSSINSDPESIHLTGRQLRDREDHETRDARQAMSDTLDRAYWFLKGMRPHWRNIGRKEVSNDPADQVPNAPRESRPPADDGRERLLRELGQVLTDALNCPSPVPPVDVVVLDGDDNPPLQRKRIQVTFDDYITPKGVLADAMLPGAVRRTRPLGERKATLVRFVCLDQRERLDTWSRRVEAWDSEYPEWAYGSEHAMWGDFNRAWRSLVGDREDARKWFKWFTNAKYREEVNQNDHT